MTEAHQEHDSPHEGPIKTPKQVILAVFFSFLIPIVVIVLLASYVSTAPLPGAGSDGLGKEAVAARIRPVAHVEIKDASDMAAMKNGEQVFAAQCTACHSAGVAGAPKLGDTAAWGPRVGQGFDTLLHSALKGKGAMGPQGGGDFSDFEIARAVVYMANKGGGSFPEPKMPAAGAAAADAGGAAAGGGTAAVGSAAAGAGMAAAAAASPAMATGGGVTPAAAAPPPVVLAAAAGATLAAAAGPAAAPAGAVPALYAQACQGCHGAGIAGAPKLGDKAAWAPRIAQGVDALTVSAIKGKGAMPPRGGMSTASDADVKAVVAYMVNEAK